MTAKAYTTRSTDSIFTAADDAFLELKQWLVSEESEALTESELQRELSPKGRELLRRLLQAHIGLRATRVPEAAVVGDDGHERTHVRPKMLRCLATAFGVVEVLRAGFGGRSMDSRFPVDADLALPPERYSLELRRQVCWTAAGSSFQTTVEQLQQSLGIAVPKRQTEELVVKAAHDFDAFYEATKVVTAPEDTGGILVLTFDGKGVVMHTEDLRPETRKAAERRRRKLSKRLTSGEKKNRKRMALVAAVYSIEPWERTPVHVVRSLGPVRDTAPKLARPKPQNKRVWASLAKNTDEVIVDAFDEALARDPGRTKRWVVLVDGDDKLIKPIEAVARNLGIKVTIIVDVIHVTEYLWKAAYVFHEPGTPEAQEWVSRRLLRILRGEAGLVAGGMRRGATMRKFSKKKRKPVDICARYLLKRKKYLGYRDYLSDGLPIATGVIEGACRHLVRDRMDITGARWRLKTAEAVLKLRALRSSGDFEQYWAFHEQQERIRNHDSRYADGVLPKLIEPSTYGHLRVVK
jgi:hypothetical protein